MKIIFLNFSFHSTFNNRNANFEIIGLLFQLLESGAWPKFQSDKLYQKYTMKFFENSDKNLAASI